jgi:hypothetical protein
MSDRKDKRIISLALERQDHEKLMEVAGKLGVCSVRQTALRAMRLGLRALVQNPAAILGSDT